jgi:hypothetical protein
MFYHRLYLKYAVIVFHFHNFLNKIKGQTFLNKIKGQMWLEVNKYLGCSRSYSNLVKFSYFSLFIHHIKYTDIVKNSTPKATVKIVLK